MLDSLMAFYLLNPSFRKAKKRHFVLMSSDKRLSFVQIGPATWKISHMGHILIFPPYLTLCGNCC